jgi:EAL domain-containing protein (putative c-di-GMP-specific phosphodiesterase class I)/ActR/RegA family two-component response regulator
VALGKQLFTVTCSIGVSVYPNDGAEPQQLLKHADIAMYRAKEAGRNQIQFYEAAMHTRIAERTMIEAELRHALPRNELSLHYQPKVDLRSGAVVGMEALLRWHHPAMGVVSPARFIGVAEETGMIVAIGRWVLRTACAQNQAWQAAGLTPLRVAVNLSARQFRDPALAGEILSALSDSGLDAQYLELELTESLMMHNVGEAVAVVAQLKRLGIALSIDDFGTGYSSLAYLKQFPVDYLKIDQSFTREMLAEPKVAAIVRSVLALGHSLGFKVIAEGVETEAQLAYLRRHGCDEMQGYFFSRPLPPNDFAELLRQERGLAPQLNAAQRPRQTLLLLDDEPSIRASLKRLFRVDGYHILSAETAEQAFDMLAMNEVQVVISDQRMPCMNGTEFLSRVKNLYPGTIRIILSGFADLESVLNAINRGEIYRFYTKPWDDQTLRENIQEAFEYHRLLHAGDDGREALE